jgi:hypothetical protein
MERTPGVERAAAEALVGALELLIAELARASNGSDIGWLRPLAVLRAEIEYSVLRGPQIDSITLADECRELSDLLEGSATNRSEFVLRYAIAYRASTAIATLHDRVLAACRRAAKRDALAG